MGFHKSGKLQLVSQLAVGQKLFIFQNGADEKYGGSAVGCSLVDHILIHREIFPQDRDGNAGCDLLQVSVPSEKIEGLREAGDGIGSAGFIASGDIQIGESLQR